MTTTPNDAVTLKSWYDVPLLMKHSITDVFNSEEPRRNKPFVTLNGSLTGANYPVDELLAGLRTIGVLSDPITNHTVVRVDSDELLVDDDISIYVGSNNDATERAKTFRTNAENYILYGNRLLAAANFLENEAEVVKNAEIDAAINLLMDNGYRVEEEN